ncbi:MAG: polysaccharide pyruvyl transferase family protein [Paludibacteraceae bacterium]|nr:polysaccharide pyruvyl transferase family protein [Paludibacteraceae bacterium]
MKNKYFILSGLNLEDNNRGTAALGYGAFSFLAGKGYLHEGQELLMIKYVRNPLKISSEVEELNIQGKVWKKRTIYLWGVHRRLFRKYNVVLPFMSLWRLTRKISFVAAINGGDGFSDIYNTNTFLARLPETLLAMRTGIPVIQLPQTLGPFSNQQNYDLAVRILKYSKAVYVRDEKYISELEKLDIPYELTMDLSAYMKPEPWNIDIIPGSVGINVSGLCYSNTFRSLSGQFNEYPNLINRLIEHFQKKGVHIYLIPHSYHFGAPEDSNDDMVACEVAYNRLSSKKDVTFINQDLISPKVKYVISKMSFFIGTRMHANFAAIYTNVPVFGLAYSYKFEGAFNANGLNAEEQTANVNNIKDEDIDVIIKKIDRFYNKVKRIR